MTARRQLLSLGVPARRVGLATPYLFFAPMTVDRRAAGVRDIVQGLQRQLRRVGFDVQVTGAIDTATARALDWLVPPAGSFAARSFSELAAIVLAAKATAAGSRAALSGSAGWEHGRDRKNCVGRGSTKATFVHLQNGLNRLATKLGTQRVKADGIIGTSTVTVAKSVANRIYQPPSALWASATCETLANNAAKIAASFHEKANALGAPAQADGPRPRRPSTGLEKTPPVSASRGTSQDALVRLAPFVLLAGGVAFVVVKMRGERA